MLLVPELEQPRGAIGLERAHRVDVVAEVVETQPAAVNLKGADAEHAAPAEMLTQIELKAGVGETLEDRAAARAAGWVAEHFVGLGNIESKPVLPNGAARPIGVAQQKLVVRLARVVGLGLAADRA